MVLALVRSGSLIRKLLRRVCVVDVLCVWVQCSATSWDCCLLDCATA